MLFQINNLEITNLKKANDYITVDIVANHLTQDDSSETILDEAFDEPTVKEFLGHGIIDYWHKTDDPDKIEEDLNKYIIGKPVAFRRENGKPVVTARLTKKHPIVQDMIPHLEANQPVYAGSVSGKKVVLEAKDSTGKLHRIIPKIKWTKLAIAPSAYVVNREPGLNVKLLKKSNDIMCDFEDFNDFNRNYSILNKEEELRKALMAPESSSDLYSKPGGVITKQSIEKIPVKLTLSDQDGLDLINTIIDLKNKKIPNKKEGYIKYFKEKNKEDFGRKSFGLIDKYFKLKKRSEVTC